MHFYSAADTSTWHVVDPLPGSPLVVFVNSKSGGGHGDKFLRRFKQILNPGQVFDLSQDGPAFGYGIKIVIKEIFIFANF